MEFIPAVYTRSSPLEEKESVMFPKMIEKLGNAAPLQNAPKAPRAIICLSFGVA